MEPAIKSLRERGKEDGYETLKKEVLDRGLCSGCGMCAAVCPKDAITYTPDGCPVLDQEKDCISCGLCAVHCPRSFSGVNEIERELFSGGRRDELGFKLGQFAARSTDSSILEIAQDGGVVSAMLKHGFESGRIDGAVLSRADEDFIGAPFLARSWEEAREAAGSKYNLSPSLVALRWARKEKLERVALVGLPCHIAAFRKLERTGPKSLTSRVVLTVGIFCSENFCSGLLMDFLRSRGVAPDRITKLDIKGSFRVTMGEETIEIPLRDMEEIVNPGCLACRDFTAELADISIGSVGAPNGWCAVLTRTKRGKDFVDSMTGEGLLETGKLTKPKTLRRLSYAKRVKGNDRLIQIMRQEAALPFQDIELSSELESRKGGKKKGKKRKSGK